MSSRTPSGRSSMSRVVRSSLSIAGERVLVAVAQAHEISKTGRMDYDAAACLEGRRPRSTRYGGAWKEEREGHVARGGRVCTHAA
jgi:hypothetical protein